MSQAYSFYCCRCSYGPWLFSIYSHCDHCGHPVDTSCPRSYVEDDFDFSDPCDNLDEDPSQPKSFEHTRKSIDTRLQEKLPCDTHNWSFYCCLCDRGPWCVAFFDNCQECYHERCPQCSATHTPDTDDLFEQEITKSNVQSIFESSELSTGEASIFHKEEASPTRVVGKSHPELLPSQELQALFHPQQTQNVHVGDHSCTRLYRHSSTQHVQYQTHKSQLVSSYSLNEHVSVPSIYTCDPDGASGENEGSDLVRVPPLQQTPDEQPNTSGTSICEAKYIGREESRISVPQDQESLHNSEQERQCVSGIQSDELAQTSGNGTSPEPILCSNSDETSENSSKRDTDQSSIKSASPAYLYLCIPKSRQGTQLICHNITDKPTDSELYSSLQDCYFSVKRWWWLSLKGFSHLEWTMVRSPIVFARLTS
jgi:hypothetical protein